MKYSQQGKVSPTFPVRLFVKENRQMATTKEKTATQEGWVKVKLPRVQGVNAVQQMFVGVNFKNYLVKTGETVEVPPEVYEVLKQSELAEDEAYKYAEDNKLREA